MVDITYPPGLLGALVDDGHRRSPIDTRRPALVGALAGFSAATGNRYLLYIGGTNYMPLNIYTSIVGDSGFGKETALSHARMCGEAGGVPPSSFSSDVALHCALAAQPKNGRDPRVQLVTMDEWGRMIARTQGDQNGHLRAMMTMMMETYGRALNGVIPERRYAKTKDNLPEVRNPFVAAAFASTPSTLIRAMTSLDVIDGSLNRVPPLWIETEPDNRPAEEILTGPLDQDLATLIHRLRLPMVEPTGQPCTGYIEPTQTYPIVGEQVTIGGQNFTVITLDPKAAKLLTDFRASLRGRRRHAGDHAAMWARAYESAARRAALCALGEALGTDPRIKPGPAIVSVRAAEWAIALIEHQILATLSVLTDQLADYEAERIQKSILRAAEQLQIEALADHDPIVENAAPLEQQKEMRELKRAGWFLRRLLVRKCSGCARSSRDVSQEINALLEGGALAGTVVAWEAGKSRAERHFLTRVPGG
jgi:hypothetical protein